MASAMPFLRPIIGSGRRRAVWRRLAGLGGYGGAVLCVAVATVTRLMIEPLLHRRIPYMLYLPAILVVAAFFGTGPAIVAVLLSIIVGDALFETIAMDAMHLVGLGIFVGVSLGIVALTRQLVRWRDVAIAGHAAVRQREAEARQLVDELTLLIDAAADHAIFFLDPAGRVALWSPSAVRLSGWSELETVGRNCDLFFSDADRATGLPRRALEAARQNGRDRSRGLRRRKDGSTFIADVTLTALYDEDGDLRGFGKVMRDVTEEATAAAELEMRERQLRSILAAAPEATVVTDAEDRITAFNRAAHVLFGYDRDDALGCDVAMLGLTTLDPEGGALRFAALSEGRPCQGNARRADGTIVPVEVTVGRATGEDQVLFTAFIRDLTEEIATRRRLDQVQAQLLHLSRISAMGTMASTLAHELNQPLTAAESFVGAARALLNQPGSGSEVERALDSASAQVLRAGSIIRHSREMLARRDTAFVNEDLDTLVREAASLGLLDARDCGIATAIAVAPAIGAVLVDRIQVQQVIVNLLRNAIDAVRDRSVRTIRLVAAADDESTIRITVEDSGPGFPEDVQDRLFTAFYSTKASGMGVGLSICRTIVEAHGGRIWAETGAAGGAAFSFTLRRAKQGEADVEDGKSLCRR